MRKLKLQVQMSLDGFVGGPNGESDWIWIGKRDEAILQKVIELADTCDTLLLGRKMARGFIDHWEHILDSQPASIEQALAKQMVSMRKIIFSGTETAIKGRNTTVENGDLVEAVQALKAEPGKDIMVYGGANFVSSLIYHNLIDEYYIFRRPVAIGKGLSIFTDQKIFTLENSILYTNGTMLHKYLPV